MGARHVPQRTCVGCRQVVAKRALIRIVKGPDGITIDPSGKAPGRGAYIHKAASCWNSARSGSLSKALRTKLTEEESNKLSIDMNGIFDDELD
jgi:hypothetical protein